MRADLVPSRDAGSPYSSQKAAESLPSYVFGSHLLRTCSRERMLPEARGADVSVAIGHGGGSISVDGEWVDWKPSGLGVASQRLLVRSIVSVEAKTASMLTNGSVAVTFAVEGGRQAAAGRVLFKRSQAQHFGPMVDWLESIADYNRANGTTPSPVQATSPASTPDSDRGRSPAMMAPTTGGVTRTSPYGQRPKWMQDGMSGTLVTGPEPLEVVGESFHQGELACAFHG